MRSPSRSTRQVSTLSSYARVALGVSLGLLTSSIANADVQIRTDLSNRTGHAVPKYSVDPTGKLVEHTGVCQGSHFHCFARIVTHDGGHLTQHTAVTGTLAKDIQSAYGITDLTMGAGSTIAIIDAYGYSTLEADLAVYRSQMGLPACTTASGCLKIVNQTGGSSLPADPPSSDDWTVESALDVQMASAACPACKILVVQATTDQDDGLFVANDTAASLNPTVISNSWGGAETGGEASEEHYFDHPGIAIFIAAGDDGYDDNGQGPDYPGTSAYTIAVGATSLSSSGNARGWTEHAWGGTGTTYSAQQISNTGAGGSACSLSIAKPSYQPANTNCSFKATADVSAVGDPATGPAIYDSLSGGWQTVGGTSASSPMVAAMIAGSGNGSITGKFFYDNLSKFNDVTSGANGSCGSILCIAGTGWDGPTGVGTPNVAAIRNTGGGGTTGGLSVAIASPSDGASVGEAFKIQATVNDAVKAELYINGTLLDTLTQGPFTFTAPNNLSAGAYTIEVTAYDATGATQTSQVTVNEDPSQAGSDGGDGETDATDPTIGNCAAGGSGIGLGTMLLAVGSVVARRRRR